MQPSVRQLFDDTWRRICAPPTADPAASSTSDSVPISPAFTAADCDWLLECGIAELVTPEMERRAPTLAYCLTFTVVEIDKLRRRLINWPIAIHAAIRELFAKSSIIPAMEHIANYLGVFQSAGGDDTVGATFDGKLAFWQVLLPASARAYQRCRDASGRLVQITRLTMGHVDSVALMQLIVASIAGHPAVVQHQFRTAAPVCDIWVDGFRYAGNHQQVQRSIDDMTRVATAARFTLKEAISKPHDEPYEFIGVRWDHRRRTVRVADKLLTRINDERVADSMTAGNIEAFIGRLIFASGVTQNALVEYYDAMQFARRVCNRLNATDDDALSVSDTVAVSPNIIAALNKWRREATATVTPATRRVSGSNVGTLFVDATLTGYGAVLVTPKNDVLIIGSRFGPQHALPSGDSPSIAAREAQTVGIAFTALERHIRKCDALRLYIDNTVAEHSLKRGCARSVDVAAAVSSVLTMSKSWQLPVHAFRISSERNPADEPSRASPVDFDKLAAAFRAALLEDAATGDSFKRLGAGRKVMILNPVVDVATTRT